MGISDITAGVNRFPLWGVIAVFLLGCVADTATTYVGLSGAFHEQTEFVVYLISQLGLLPGLVVAKGLTVVMILCLAGITRSWAVGRVLSIVAGLFYGVAGLMNLLVLGGVW